jgi:hypothetical protein
MEMQITLTWQSLIGAAAIVGAFVALVSYIRKIFGWFERQEKQDAEIKSIKEEQGILTKGILACLKGLSEQGCDGPVTEAITEIEDHINKKAHGR